VGRVAYSTRNGVQEVAGNSTTVIIAASRAIVEFGRCQVAIVVVGTILVGEEALLTVHVWIQVAVMLGIAVSQANGRKSLAIIVNDQSTEDYLVTTVPVNIDNGIVMIALTVPG
jgi:hypothetical protein